VPNRNNHISGHEYDVVEDCLIFCFLPISFFVNVFFLLVSTLICKISSTNNNNTARAGPYSYIPQRLHHQRLMSAAILTLRSVSVVKPKSAYCRNMPTSTGISTLLERRPTAPWNTFQSLILSKHTQQGPRNTIVWKPRSLQTRQQHTLVPAVSALLALHPVYFYSTSTTHCEVLAQQQHAHDAIVQNNTLLEKTAIKRWWRNCMRALRMVRRFIQLCITLTPVALLYPLLTRNRNSHAGDDAHQVALANITSKENAWLDWYLHFCLSCVEHSGAAVIKLMQWASSRPDMFGHDFCHVFEALQDHARPHSPQHTERVLREAFGENWQQTIRLHEILGSGCIGQVRC
jgi:hypothetical protein